MNSTAHSRHPKMEDLKIDPALLFPPDGEVLVPNAHEDNVERTATPDNTSSEVGTTSRHCRGRIFWDYLFTLSSEHLFR